MGIGSRLRVATGVLAGLLMLAGPGAAIVASLSIADSPATGRADMVSAALSVPGGVPQVYKTCNSNVSIYGVLGDGRLTYSSIDPNTGNRQLVTTSSASLGFVPKALATLNFNTLLVTHPTSGHLYRVDIVTNATSVQFNSPVDIGSGWTHDRLTYDGKSHLYGLASGVLLQYTLTAAKPGAADIANRRQVGTGFTVSTLTSSAPDRLYATTSDGRLIHYTVTGTGWTSITLEPSGWGGFTQLVSPHGGLIYGKVSNGGMYWYEDAGSTTYYHNDDPVDLSGWTQVLLSAQPATCLPPRRQPAANPYGPSLGAAGTYTPRMKFILTEVVAAFPELSGHCSTYVTATEDHSTGNATDCRPGSSFGTLPTSAEQGVGTELKRWTRFYSARLAVQYVIWQDKIWNIGIDAATSDGRCQHGCPAPGTLTSGVITSDHYDHVHISAANSGNVVTPAVRSLGIDSTGMLAVGP
jgi:Tachylectin